MINKNDIAIIRTLAAQTADIAALPVQAEKRRLWRRLNSLEPERPMVMIDQVCWNEMSFGDELPCSAPIADCRDYEELLRRTLFQWKHFPVDMVVEALRSRPQGDPQHQVRVSKCRNTVTVTDLDNTGVAPVSVTSSAASMILRKCTVPRSATTARETDRRLSCCPRALRRAAGSAAVGADPYLSIWDPITTWMGMQNALFALKDQPDLLTGWPGA